VLVRQCWWIAAKILNVSKLNNRMKAWMGDCDQSDYNWLKASAGQPYTPPTDALTLPPPGYEFAYEWGVYWDFTIDAGSWAVSNINQGTYYPGIGWGATTLEASDNFCNIFIGLNRVTTGIKVYVSPPMGGNLNSFVVRTKNASPGEYPSTAAGEAIIERALNNFAPVNFEVSLAEFTAISGVGDEMAVRITRIEIFGTGAVPSVGTLL